MKTLSTGTIAELCDVNVRTVIRWIDKGDLKGFKLPGHGNNRVREEDFITFLQNHHIPLPSQFTDIKAKRILIVDDDRRVAQALQRTFKYEGYEAAIASDGFQAGVELANYKPQLMTLDLSMPSINGVEILQYVRQHAEFKNLKIIVISALNEVFINKTLSNGADAALLKPYNSKQLVDLVSTLLSVDV